MPLRYVLLHHVTPEDSPRPTHFDFMLEEEGDLLTWALPEKPAIGKTLTAEELPPHRLAYLHLQGPLSNDRGEVTQVDAGIYRNLEATDSFRSVELSAGNLVAQVTFKRTGDHLWRIGFSEPIAAV